MRHNWLNQGVLKIAGSQRSVRKKSRAPSPPPTMRSFKTVVFVDLRARYGVTTRQDSEWICSRTSVKSAFSTSAPVKLVLVSTAFWKIAPYKHVETRRYAEALSRVEDTNAG